MKNLRLTCSILFFCILSSLFSQKNNYSPTWSSLNTRPIPTWFEDAKFGIFIHWGLYSIPAWSPRGTYAEWYKEWLEKKNLFGNGDFNGDEVYKHHKHRFGEDFQYADFAPMFTAIQYNPEAWVDLLKKAGAKYIVFTTKHHDGFCLWNSKEASRDYGRAWNSVEIGAKRDLVGELATAIRKTDLKFGCYYSMLEWGNPLFTPNTMNHFVEKHTLPQLKELVNLYEPDILWADGSGGINDTIWQTKEFLTWLYNESPVKNKIVVNDRWAKGMRYKYGDFVTPEYKPFMTFEKPWEECRGIGLSFGYNMNETLDDYTSPQGLILTLVNIVSNGGNLLLNIGPDANGNIPTIMEERLVQIGKWLSVNGEAIYGTRCWRITQQWSEGNRDWKSNEKLYVSGNTILKQTVNPDKGFAVKEAFFTFKNNTLYAILPVLPDNKIELRDIQVEPGTEITLLGYDKALEWEQKGKNIEVYFPKLSIYEIPCEYAWTIKIENIR